MKLSSGSSSQIHPNSITDVDVVVLDLPGDPLGVTKGRLPRVHPSASSASSGHPRAMGANGMKAVRLSMILMFFRCPVEAEASWRTKIEQVCVCVCCSFFGGVFDFLCDLVA